MADTVTVGCSLKSGLVLRPFKMVVVDNETRAVPDGDVIVLGYGDNPGIDAERVKGWLEANKDHEFVTNGIVYVLPETPAKALKPLGPADADDQPAQASDAAARQIKAGGKGNS